MISEATKAAIKRTVTIEAVLVARGIELRRHGARDLACCCPFHDERTPSFIVTPDKGLWVCKGACAEGGDVIALYRRFTGLGFVEAVEQLAKGITPDELVIPVPASAPAPALPPSEPPDAQAVLRSVLLDYYPSRLTPGSAGWNYLELRGLADPAARDRFRIGVCDRTFPDTLPSRVTRAGESMRATLHAVNVLRDTGHEFFRGCITFPITSEDGDVLGCYGRRIHIPSKGTPRHWYLPGPHRGVWNWQGLADANGEAVLCEAIIDALTLWCAGYRNVTASYGAGGFTADHLAAFTRYGIRRVLVAYDNDQAGNQGAERVVDDLHAAGLACWRVQLPSGIDVNEFARTVA